MYVYMCPLGCIAFEDSRAGIKAAQVHISSLYIYMYIYVYVYIYIYIYIYIHVYV